MKEKRNDRRVRYTKMVIKQSFIKLLKQKSISKISIKEICEDADINRATFYSHYKNQYDLLKQIENETINDINQYLSSYDSKSKNYIPFDPIEKTSRVYKEKLQNFSIS